MSTWSLNMVDKTTGLAVTSHRMGMCVLQLKSNPEAAPKSVPLDALGKHLEVRQCGLKL